MRTLVLGAGATGGYFGGRMVEAGNAVTFLVRSGRAQQLRRDGLVMRSPLGDVNVKDPDVIEKAAAPYDLVLLSCKAYDLTASMNAIQPAVGSQTMIVPLLNGIKHIEDLQSRFGETNVLGGCCIISSVLHEDGHILHLNDTHTIKFGEWSGGTSQRIQELEQIMTTCKFVSQAHTNIKQAMWEKWVMITSLAALTTMMRGSVGEIAMAPGGKEVAERLTNECFLVLKAHGFEPNQKFVYQTFSRLTDTTSFLKASMLRDMERGGKTEAEHIIGDFIEKAEQKQVDVPTLKTAYCNLSVHERSIGRT